MSMKTNQTMTDVAYQFLEKRKREVDFDRLYSEVVKQLKISEEDLKKKKGQLYSDLMLDRRFAALEGNKWDLKGRRKFEETFVNTSDMSLDEENAEDMIEEEALDIPSGDDAY